MSQTVNRIILKMFIKWLNTKLNMNKFMLIKKIVDTFGQPHFSKVYPKFKWDSLVGYFMHLVIHSCIVTVLGLILLMILWWTVYLNPQYGLFSGRRICDRNKRLFTTWLHRCMNCSSTENSGWQAIKRVSWIQIQKLLIYGIQRGTPVLHSFIQSPTCIYRWNRRGLQSS